MKKQIRLLFISFFFILTYMNAQGIDLVNPSKSIGINDWNIVNDDVMGGVSNSDISVNDDNKLIFRGNLSLENNGGFASSRLDISEKNLSGLKSFKIKLKGDGNTYKLRLRQNDRRVSYSHNFNSKKNKWIEVNLPLEDFRPTWRGYYYSDYPDIDIDKISSLSLHISDKQEGEFILEIEYIKAIN